MIGGKPHGRVAAQPQSSIVAAIPIACEILEPVIGRLSDEGWLVLDTTGMDVDAAVEAILAHGPAHG